MGTLHITRYARTYVLISFFVGRAQLSLTLIIINTYLYCNTVINKYHHHYFPPTVPYIHDPMICSLSSAMIMYCIYHETRGVFMCSYA